MAPGNDDMLSQFSEFLKARNEAEGGAADYGVNLSTTDADGAVHSIQGVPLSRVGADFLARFGIGDGKAESGKAEGGKAEGGKAEGGKAEGAPVSPLRAFFPQGSKGQQAG
jgi:hypothetical protein